MSNKTPLSAADGAARPKKQQRALKPRCTSPEASKSIYDDFRQKGYEDCDINMTVCSESKTLWKAVKDAIPGTHVGHVGAALYIHWVTSATRGVLFFDEPSNEAQRLTFVRATELGPNPNTRQRSPPRKADESWYGWLNSVGTIGKRA